MNRPLWFAAATLIYAFALIPVIGPDPWMWRIWLPAWVLFSVVGGVAVWRGTPWQTTAIPWTAGVTFTIVTILSSVLETRSHERIGAVFLLFGAGLAAAVALFLMSYDRSKRPGAEAD